MKKLLLLQIIALAACSCELFALRGQKNAQRKSPAIAIKQAPILQRIAVARTTKSTPAKPIIQHLAAARAAVTPIAAKIAPIKPIIQRLAARITTPIATKQPVQNQQAKITTTPIPVLQQSSTSTKPWIYHQNNIEQLTLLPGLSWGQIRRQEGLNCGYHALKNLSLIMKDATNTPVNIQAQQNQLLNPNSPLRQSLIRLDPHVDFMQLWAPIIYHQRSRNNPHQACPINHLHGGEIETLLKNEFSRNFNDILVVDYVPLPSKHLQRINQFKQRQFDRLGIIWNEPGFNHWVGYLLYKINNQIKIYYFNSAGNSMPRTINTFFTQYLLQ